MSEPEVKVHMLVDRKKGETTTRCGITFKHTTKDGKGIVVSVWDNLINCPDCKGATT